MKHNFQIPQINHEIAEEVLNSPSVDVKQQWRHTSTSIKTRQSQIAEIPTVRGQRNIPVESGEHLWQFQCEMRFKYSRRSAGVRLAAGSIAIPAWKNIWKAYCCCLSCCCCCCCGWCLHPASAFAVLWPCSSIWKYCSISKQGTTIEFKTIGLVGWITLSKAIWISEFISYSSIGKNNYRVVSFFIVSWRNKLNWINSSNNWRM